MVTYMKPNTDDVHNKSSTVLSSKLLFRIVCCVFFSVALDVRSVSVSPQASSLPMFEGKALFECEN